MSGRTSTEGQSVERVCYQRQEVKRVGASGSGGDLIPKPLWCSSSSTPTYAAAPLRALAPTAVSAQATSEFSHCGRRKFDDSNSNFVLLDFGVVTFVIKPTAYTICEDTARTLRRRLSSAIELAKRTSEDEFELLHRVLASSI